MDKQAFNYAFDLGIREIAIELEKQAGLGTKLATGIGTMAGAVTGAAAAGEGKRLEGLLLGGAAGGAAGLTGSKLINRTAKAVRARDALRHNSFDILGSGIGDIIDVGATKVLVGAGGGTAAGVGSGLLLRDKKVKK